MKKCTICKKDKELSEFNKNKGRKDGLNNLCKNCSRQRSKKYYKDNPEEHKSNVLERNRKLRKERKELRDSIKSQGCKYCPEKTLVCLDFHHKDPNQKDNEVSQMLLHSLSVLENEISKCEIVCANCHRKIHAGLL